MLGVLTKYTKGSVSGPMTRGHKTFNKYFNACRQRIEHVIGHIKVCAGLIAITRT